MLPPNARILLAPSILSADFGRLADEVRAVEAAGADWIHLDVMDGHFVPNVTIGPIVVDAVRRVTRLPLDVHLMVEDPDRWIVPFADAGADLLCVHAEATHHLHRTLGAIRAAGKRAAVALNPHSSLESLRYVLDEVSMVLLMSVNPGFGGQVFIPQALRKIRDLRAEIVSRGLDIDIEIDGGLKVGGSVAAVVEAGANVIVSGSGVFHTPDYAVTLKAMRSEAEGARAK